MVNNIRATKRNGQKYYEVEPIHESSFYTNFKLVNWGQLQPDKKGLTAQVSWPDGVHAVTRGPWTIPDYVEVPHFVIAKRKANVLSEFGIIDGFMFISTKLKMIFDELAPGSCDYRLCTTSFSDGTSGPETWLCSVTRVFRQAVDIPKSKVKVTSWGYYSFLDYQFTGGGNLVFLKEKIGDNHLFQIAEFSPNAICDEHFRETCRSHKFRGLSFKQIGELSE